jgi:thiamine-monophosphate kinase
VIELERLPLSDTLMATMAEDRAHQLALSGGDDYELLFSAASGSDVRRLRGRLGVPVARIGSLQAGAGVAVTFNGKPMAVAPGGYNHFP